MNDFDGIKIQGATIKKETSSPGTSIYMNPHRGNWFLFMSRQDVGYTQPPIQWVTEFVPRVMWPGCAVNHSHPSSVGLPCFCHKEEKGGEGWAEFPTYWPCEKDIQLVTTLLNISPCQ